MRAAEVIAVIPLQVGLIIGVHIKLLQGIHLFAVSLQQLVREVDDVFLGTRLFLFVLGRLTVYFLMMFCRIEKFVLLQIHNSNNA